MRKIITAAFVSLDGVIQAPGGPHEDPTGGFAYGGWALANADPVFGEEVEKLFSEPFDLLLGRRTYEIFAAHWPHSEGGPDDFIAKRFNECTKYVATRSDMPLTWRKSVRLNDAATDVACLKQESGPVLVTQGSSELIQTLLRHDLIDELRTLTFPVVLASGKKLFRGGARPGAFELTHSRVSPNGIIAATYERAGDVKTGDYGMSPPTAAELARREKLKREEQSLLRES